VNGLDEAKRKTIDVATAQKEMQKSTSLMGNAFKAFGNIATTVLSTVGNMILATIASFVVSKVFEGLAWLWDQSFGAKAARAQAGREATQKVADIRKEMKTNEETANDDTIKRYNELRKGVDISGNSAKNISLTNDEYSEFLSINQELITTLPTLSTVFDDQGNRLLNLGNNAKEAGEKIKEALNFEQYKKAQEIREQLPKMIAANSDSDKEMREEIAQLEK